VSSYNEPIRILVVDDDPGIRRLLVILFQREGWIVTTVADGELAVEQIALARPDVVVLDLMLPKRSGVEVLQDATVQDYPSAERVLVLTAASEAQLRRLPTDFRIRQLIRKPFDNFDLVQSVRAAAPFLALIANSHHRTAAAVLDRTGHGRGTRRCNHGTASIHGLARRSRPARELPHRSRRPAAPAVASR
jgi:CheY-like chemotaxis protein